MVSIVYLIFFTAALVTAESKSKAARFKRSTDRTKNDDESIARLTSQVYYLGYRLEEFTTFQQKVRKLEDVNNFHSQKISEIINHISDLTSSLAKEKERRDKEHTKPSSDYINMNESTHEKIEENLTSSLHNIAGEIRERILRFEESLKIMKGNIQALKENSLSNFTKMFKDVARSRQVTDDMKVRLDTTENVQTAIKDDLRSVSEKVNLQEQNFNKHKTHLKKDLEEIHDNITEELSYTKTRMNLISDNLSSVNNKTSILQDQYNEFREELYQYRQYMEENFKDAQTTTNSSPSDNEKISLESIKRAFEKYGVNPISNKTMNYRDN
ncbi:uncharacterized protein LOC106472008 [Limulus polyphemus]|uniref:Uncharacterized protein LOC106472008 n=1 Tax=Limulus polyphemus TaxID=6850 RepID=A0ABM1BT10_LIMPO|nr:uncharacterized protein LOC106472008 [Limulus polyphemus]